LVWLGALSQATERVTLATSVLTPTLRYQPAVVAQAFATLACLSPGRVLLGVGSGEAMNETPVTAAAWPKFKERSARLAESIELIRALWSGERVSFEGTYYRTARATIYDRPEQPVPVYIAAGGP
jgi:coenzyme F420-dependent glucose-6-phosphate dehydrogenase